MLSRKLLAAGVHFYTGIGLILAFVAALSLKDDNEQVFLIALWLAVIIDATDGALARFFEVKKVLPDFDGRKLDDIIDYINYAFLPAVAMIVFHILPDGLTWVAMLPVLASAYGFCQDQAKTTDSFVGFPSYWNVVFLYLYFFPFNDILTAIILILLSILVFVPIRYIYPSQTPWMKTPTLVFSFIYGLMVGILCLFPKAAWVEELAFVSLFYPVYYAVLSFVHHRRVTHSPAPGNESPG